MTVGILGCGWLGMPLALQLQQEGIGVRTSRASAKGVQALRSQGLQAHQIVLDAHHPQYDPQFFEGLSALIIAVPPGLRKNPARRFDAAVAHLMTYCTPYAIPHLLFCSSISVYGVAGDPIDETTPCKPQTPSGQQLLACEQHVLAAAGKATIFRLGGLIGADRHPIHSFAKRRIIPNPKAPINLVHQDEVLAYCRAWIQRPATNAVFNVVSPLHQPREAYYSQCAKQLEMPQLQFGETTPFKGSVLSNKIVAHYGDYFNVKKLLILS